MPTYHDPEYKKFANRHVEGIAVGYGPQQSVIVLDQKKFFDEGVAHFVTTPHVQLHPSELPL